MCSSCCLEVCVQRTSWWQENENKHSRGRRRIWPSHWEAFYPQVWNGAGR